MGILQCEKTQRRGTVEAVQSYSARLNEHLHKLICLNKDGTQAPKMKAVIQWSDDFTRVETQEVFVDEEDRSRKFKVTM